MLEMNKFLPFRLLLLIISFLWVPVLVSAQDPGDPAGDPDIPLDGGVGILVAAGIGYGYKKYRNARKKADQLDF